MGRVSVCPCMQCWEGWQQWQDPSQGQPCNEIDRHVICMCMHECKSPCASLHCCKSLNKDNTHIDSLCFILLVLICADGAGEDEKDEKDVEEVHGHQQDGPSSSQGCMHMCLQTVQIRHYPWSLSSTWLVNVHAQVSMSICSMPSHLKITFIHALCLCKYIYIAVELLSGPRLEVFNGY